jgi:putative hemolysin
LLVVSNHPSGGSDALVLCGEVITQRPDTLVMVNEMLSRSQALQSVIIPVSIMDSATPEQKARTLKSIKQTMSHLRKGGCVLIFPAGEVSRWQWRKGRIEDGAWSEHIAVMAQRAGAAVVPAWVQTSNPPWFYVLAAVSGLAGAAVLPLCLYLARGQAVRFAFGSPILSESLTGLSADEAIIALRHASESLAEHY